MRVALAVLGAVAVSSIVSYLWGRLTAIVDAEDARIAEERAAEAWARDRDRRIRASGDTRFWISTRRGNCLGLATGAGNRIEGA